VPGGVWAWRGAALGAARVKRLHASATQVAVSLITYPGVKYQYVPTIVLDVETETTETLPVGGVTTLVP
jgi:hypothetical protein